MPRNKVNKKFRGMKPGDKKADGTIWLSKEEFLKRKNANAPPMKALQKNVSKQREQKKEKRVVLEKPLHTAANSQSVINVPATFSPPSFQLMWLSVWTRMFEKAWNAMPPTYGTSYILDAFQIMQLVTSQVMVGTTPGVRQLPIFVQTVLNLVSPKDVAFRIQMLKYSWTSAFTPTVGSIIPVLPANFPLQWVFGDPDVGTDSLYTALINPFSPLLSSDDTNLQVAFGLIQDLNADTKLVPTDTIKMGKNDPSAFARTYAYLGIGNSPAGSVYGECEQETNFVKSWMAAQFCVFNTDDTRASRSFRPQSGDSCLLSGLPLIPGMRMRDYKSGAPVIYKFIDFEEIYYYYVEWLTAAWAAALAIPNSALIPSNLSQNLPFTYQTFRIILRQALLQCFSNQALVQFMAPKPRNGTMDNVFVPFIMNSGTYSAEIFGGMKFPLILAENMKMLKTTIRKVGTSGAKIVHVPVLGKWCTDNYLGDPQIQDPYVFTESTGLTNQSIFLDPTSETTISLYDGSGAPGDFYNMNATYYQTAMEYLNNLLSQFGNAGGQLSTVSGDGGPGLSLLDFTRFVATAPESMLAKKMRKYECLIEQRERVVELKRTKSKGKGVRTDTPRPDDLRGGPNGKLSIKESKINPDGGVAFDYSLSISSNVALSQELQAVLKSFILPVIRPDSTDSLQPQTYSEWQIAYIEPNLASLQLGGDGAVVSSYRADDLAEAAVAPITNILNGTNSSDIVACFQKLVEEGGGADWMAILKGVVGVVGAGAQIASSFF